MTYPSGNLYFRYFVLSSVEGRHSISPPGGCNRQYLDPSIGEIEGWAAITATGGDGGKGNREVVNGKRKEAGSWGSGIIIATDTVGGWVVCV